MLEPADRQAPLYLQTRMGQMNSARQMGLPSNLLFVVGALVETPD